MMKSPTPAPRRRTGITRWVAAGSLALFLAGAISFYAGYRLATVRAERQFAIVEAEHWLTEIAAYHRLYSADARHLVEVPGSKRQYIESWLGERLEQPLRVPDLSPAGLQFQGARLLAIGDGPAAQLMYMPVDGRPVAVCITGTTEPDQGPQFIRRDGVGLLYWRQGGTAMVLVAWEDEPRLRAWHTLVAPSIGPAPAGAPPRGG